MSTPDQHPGRAFAVGCSRSGTTVVQRHLAAHPAIQSFPETDFLGRLLGNTFWQTIAHLGWIRSSKSDAAFDKLTRATGSTPEAAPNGRLIVPTSDCIQAFIDHLDNLTLADNKTMWLEKTPKHFRHLSAIDRFVPDARVLHVIRNGPDTVASIRHRARTYPREFGHQANPAYAVRLWNHSVQTALNRHRAGKDRIMLYERFLESPATCLADACAFFGLPYRAHMLEPASSDLIQDSEPWKHNTIGGLYRPRSRFHEVFSAIEQRWIQRHLDFASYEAIVSVTPPLDSNDA